MRIDMLNTDNEKPRSHHLFRLTDAAGLRALEIELPLMPDYIPAWVSRVEIPRPASPEQRAGALDLLRAHPWLRELRLEFAGNADVARELASLGDFRHLTALDVFAPGGHGANTRPVELNAISELRQLRTLRVYAPVPSIEALAQLSELRELELHHPRDTIWFTLMAPSERHPDPWAVDAGALGNLRHLRKLSLNCVNDLRPLVALTELEELCLDYSDVMDLAPLRSLPRLRRLSLDHTLVRDLAVLGELGELRELSLGGCAAADVRPLGACAQLERLSLSGSHVPDLSPLQACRSLEQLDLSHGAPDLRQLSGMAQLRALSLEATAVTDLMPLKDCARLELCNLQGTPLDSHLAEFDFTAPCDLLSRIRAGMYSPPHAPAGAAADAPVSQGRIGRQ